MTQVDSFEALIAACHRELEEAFLVHQEALVAGNIARARSLLAAFIVRHELHRDFEDAELIPALADGVSGERWPASLYSLEHAKIADLLSGVEAELAALCSMAPGGRDYRRALIALLEREKTLKGVIEHHHEREEAGLLPEVDAASDAGRRAAAIRAFRASWAACRAPADDAVDTT